MTLAPLVNPTIHGIMGKPVDLPAECACPGCGRPAMQRHHLWPKSFLRGQPFEWVSVNGIILANSIGLCLGHHTEVTGDTGGHAAKIVYDETLQVFEWWEAIPDDDWMFVGRLNSDEFLHETEASRQRKKEGLCPTCGKPHSKPALAPRKTKTWTVNVPADAEDGASVLDEYVDDLSVVLGYGDESKGVRRYHVLANVLAWVMTVKPDFIEDWEEAGRV